MLNYNLLIEIIVYKIEQILFIKYSKQPNRGLLGPATRRIRTKFIYIPLNRILRPLSYVKLLLWLIITEEELKGDYKWPQSEHSQRDL